MKLITFLLNRSGKLALTTAQAIGAAAVVGVGGLALMQFGNSSSVNPDTVFSSQDDSEVVYVAGASGGSYEGVGYGAYGEGGEVRSGIRAKLSRDMQLMDLDAQRVPQTPKADIDRQEAQVQAYSMDGRSTGLGMGKNAAKEITGDANGDLSALQAQIAQIQAAAQQGATAQAQQAGVESEAAKAAAGAFGRGGGMHVTGNNLNSTPLQAGQGANGKGGGVLGGATAGADKGTRLTARHQSPTFTADRDSIVSEGQRFRSVGSLEGMRKVSADVAGNRNRSVNEAVSGTFLASGARSGLLQVTGDSSSLGGGTSSDDYKDISRNMPNLSGANAEIENYRNAQDALKKKLDKFVDRMNGIACTFDILTFGLGSFLNGIFGNVLNGWIKNILNALNPGYALSVVSRWISDLFDKESGDIKSAISTFKTTYSKQKGAELFADQVETIRLKMYTPGVANACNAPKDTYQEFREQYWEEDAENVQKNKESGFTGGKDSPAALKNAD